MIIDAVLTNLHDAPAEERRELDACHRETVVLPSAALVKRVQRVVTDHGRELGIRLPPGSADLRDGDVLLRDETGIVVVGVEPTDVLVIAPRSIEEMGATAHALGNRHLQAQFFGADSEYGAEVMVVQYDHTVADFLGARGVPHDRQERVMPVPFRHAEHTH